MDVESILVHSNGKISKPFFNIWFDGYLRTRYSCSYDCAERCAMYADEIGEDPGRVLLVARGALGPTHKILNEMGLSKDYEEIDVKRMVVTKEIVEFYIKS